MDAAPELPNLKNHFLLAMPGLNDPMFAHSLAYICEHGEEGAMGIVVNRPLDLCWRDVFEQLELADSTTGDELVLAGGPVHMDRGFILHPPVQRNWDSSIAITREVALTTSMDIISSLADGEGPDRSLMALGYAGWGSGQLEHELANNFWLTLPADVEILFDTPCERKLEMAAARLGINMDLLSPDAGHA